MATRAMRGSCLDGQGVEAGHILRERLLPALNAIGYPAFHAGFEGRCWRNAEWTQAASACPDTLRRAVAFFLLGKKLPRHEAEGLADDQTLRALDGMGLLREQDGLLDLGNFTLLYPGGLPLFTQQHHDPDVYFGDDSLGLCARLRARGRQLAAGGRVLDICAGSGIQGMTLMQGGARGTFIEANPQVVPLLSMNLALNSLAGRADIRLGSGAEILAEQPDETWDYACWNPPLLPLPHRSSFQFVGDGGSDGLEVTHGLMHALRGGKRALHGLQFVGTTIVPKQQAAADIVERIFKGTLSADLGARVWVTARRTLGFGSPLLINMLQTAHMKWITDGVSPYDAVAKAGPIIEMYGQDDADLILFAAEAGGGIRGRSLIELTDLPNSSSYWFV